MQARVAWAFVLSIAMAGAGHAQQNSRTGEVRPQAAGTPASAQKAVLISGTVSQHGARLATEDGGIWKVNNPHLLAGRDGHALTVKCLLSTDQSAIHVLSVAGEQKKYMASSGDAAFRR